MTGPTGDGEVLAALTASNDWLRSLLCTLARRGTQVRRESRERYDALIEALSPWPWFKGGQFLFDLLELEDFMTDGPAPPILPAALDGIAWERIRAQLVELKSLFDGAVSTATANGGPDESGGPSPDGMGGGAETSAMWTEPLPPLEPGLHLYRDVAVGMVVSAAPFVSAGRRTG